LIVFLFWCNLFEILIEFINFVSKISYLQNILSDYESKFMLDFNFAAAIVIDKAFSLAKMVRLLFNRIGTWFDLQLKYCVFLALK